jgi:signal transduction histidine kinase
MRSKDDLERITPLIWHELTVLGVPFIRCGVFIMDNENSVLQSYLSTPDGKSLGVYDLPYGSTEIAKKLLQRWKIKKTYKEHWDKDQFLNFMNTMAKRGLIQNQQVYQGDAKPPESLDLHFVPFKQGMLYVGNHSPLEADALQLVKSLADAFSIAYARYEDFTQLEQAKNQTEQAFSELKSTQTQLIQSEKMASLGELTAGIAHEIQNPLNFVNNFSEVSKELIEEMNDEIEAGNLEDVKEISEDIKQNLDKINHHGQRASSIVKGMLEHSRTSKKEKELTDLNLLADEYLRLSYHGLRAKDKSFNADFKLELDEDLPKVNVIGQEIGRVLLNLINNAFYAVSKRARKQLIDSEEKVKDSEKPDYIPTVIVKTKKIDKFIEIRVRDNGDGIPPQVIDKIFQPFFTTKPTGQGTGLGLSLSYDIITKGHNGSLEVDSVEGLGTEFIIRL